MKYRLTRKINAVPTGIRAVLFPLVILLGIEKLFELNFLSGYGEGAWALFIYYIGLGVKLLDISGSIAFALILAFCLQKASRRSHFFSILLLVTVLNAGTRMLTGLIRLVPGYSSINNYVELSLLSTVVGLAALWAALALTKMSMARFPYFRPQRTQWLPMGKTERTFFYVLLCLMVLADMGLGLLSAQALLSAKPGGFLGLLDILTAESQFRRLRQGTGILLNFALVSLVFRPLKFNS